MKVDRSVKEERGDLKLEGMQGVFLRTFFFPVT